MNADTTPGVITASIELDLDLQPSPEGLLRLSETFEFAGYTKLARYLRRCGDALSAKKGPVGVVEQQRRLGSGLLSDAGEDRL